MDCFGQTKCPPKYDTKLRAQEIFLGWSRLPKIQDYIIEIFWPIVKHEKVRHTWICKKKDFPGLLLQNYLVCKKYILGPYGCFWCALCDSIRRIAQKINLLWYLYPHIPALWRNKKQSISTRHRVASNIANHFILEG